MTSKQGNSILHNAWVTLYVLSILTIAALLILVACGSGEESLFSVTRHRAYKAACMEYGYPDYWLNINTKAVFCLRRNDCTDEVVKLSDLRKRGQ